MQFMAGTVTTKRILYSIEALAILLLAPLGLYPSLFSFLVLASLPALVLAVIGALRPSYLDPLDLTDPRRGPRRYLHTCAALCGAAVVFFLLNLALP